MVEFTDIAQDLHSSTFSELTRRKWGFTREEFKAMRILAGRPKLDHHIWQGIKKCFEVQNRKDENQLASLLEQFYNPNQPAEEMAQIMAQVQMEEYKEAEQGEQRRARYQEFKDAGPLAQFAETLIAKLPQVALLLAPAAAAVLLAQAAADRDLHKFSPVADKAVQAGILAALLEGLKVARAVHGSIAEVLVEQKFTRAEAVRVRLSCTSSNLVQLLQR